MSGHLLVEHGYVVDRVAVQKGVHECQVAVTDQPEDRIDPFDLQGAHERCRAGYLSRVARVSTPVGERIVHAPRSPAFTGLWQPGRKGPAMMVIKPGWRGHLLTFVFYLVY